MIARLLRLTLLLGSALALVALSGLSLHVGRAAPGATTVPEAAVNFGQGAYLQVIDPEGRRSIDFNTSARQAQIPFLLHALPLDQLLPIYRATLPWQPLAVDTTSLTQVATWVESVDQDANRPSAHIPASVPPGVYVLTAGESLRGQSQIIVVVSRYVLALKGGDAQVVVWAARLQTGAPVEGMIITMHDADGVSMPVTTDSRGVAGADAAWDDSTLVVGRLGDELAVAGLRSEWRTDWWGGWWGWETASPHQRTYIYTDRPVYRPDQDVYFKAILRQERDVSYTLPSATDPVTVTLRDSRSNIVATRQVQLSEFGTVDGSFHLASQVSLGDYTVQLTHGTGTAERTFQVQEYRKPEFEVKVAATPDAVILGDPLTVSVAADYYFGAPVPNAPVNVKVKRTGWWWYGPSDVIAEANGVTDAQGRWTGQLPTKTQTTWDSPLTVEASVTDATAQVVTGQTTVQSYWASLVLETETPRHAYQPGETVAPTLTLHDRHGQPVANHTLAVTTTRYYNAATPTTTRQTVTTGADGTATLTYTHVDLGWYTVEASAVDNRGRTVQTWSYFWVYDPSRSGGWYTQQDTIEVKADAASYQPGDTAHLLIRSPLSGPALLTLERGRVRREMVVQLTGAATQVDVPILADDAPTLYARVHIWQRSVPNEQAYWVSATEGRLLVSPPLEMAVSPAARRLSVDIRADKSEYRPGETATLSLLVANGGQPARAEVSVALVDEAIFALAEDNAGDPFDFFYGRRDLGVGTWDSLKPVRYLDATDRFTPLPTGTPAVPPGPIDAAPEAGGQQVRQVFRDTAYWNARIVTDANGRATVNVPLPDNLTRWRVVVRAVTADTLAGLGQSRITVTKPVAVQPGLPRFLVLGDRVALDTVVTNRTATDIHATVNLSDTSLVLLSAPPAALVVPAGQQRAVRWSAVASRVGISTLNCEADAGAVGDAVATPLPIKPFAIPQRQARAGLVEGAADLAFDVPLNALTDDSAVELRLSPSIALSLLDGLDELVDYPYGCVEQTMSRVLPNAAVAQTYRRLGIANPDLERRLPDIMADGLQRLYSFQHPDGGWSWWYDDDSAVYQTAYVLFGLLQVREAGFAVDASVLSRGLDFLAAHLTNSDPLPAATPRPIATPTPVPGAGSSLDPRLRAYALYVQALGGQGNLAASQALLTQPDRLDPFGLAALSLTLLMLGDTPGANRAADALAARAVETGAGVHWVAPRNEPYTWRTMLSDEKTTGMALRALAQVRPTSALLPGAARWLMDRRDGRAWSTTQASSFALLGLTDYILVSGELDADYDWRVTHAGAVLAQGHVDRANATQPIPSVTLRGSQLTPGENTLRVEKTGAGRLYYTLAVRLSLFYPQFEATASAGTGIQVSRGYRLSEAVAGGVRGTSDREFALGDVVEVRLGVELSEDAHYVIIEDHLPAGFEALSERINPLIWTPWDVFRPVPFWREYGYNNKEVRDDRVSFFVTWLGAGQHEFTYRMRATRPGQFSALPAEAYPMYRPEIWGRSASDQVTVGRGAFTEPTALRADRDRSCAVDEFDVRLATHAWSAGGADHADPSAIARVLANVGRTCADGDAPQPTPDAITPRLRLAPRSAQVPVGGQFLVDVILEGASTIRGYDVAVAVAPDLARVEAIQPALLSDVVALGPGVDAGRGRAAWGAVTRAPIAGEGLTLGTLRLTALQPGVIRLAVESAQILDRGGQPHAAELVPAEVSTDGYRLALPYVQQRVER